MFVVFAFLVPVCVYVNLCLFWLVGLVAICQEADRRCWGFPFVHFYDWKEGMLLVLLALLGPIV